MTTKDHDALPRYRVVEEWESPGVYEVFDTTTASGRWRRVETHTQRALADAAAAWWNARASGGGK